MIWKITISFVLLAFLNFIGCYSAETITKKDIDEGKEQIDFNQEIAITTKNYKLYRFGALQYQIVNDSLYGNGIVTELGKEVPFKGNIALDDILSFEQSSMDTGSTAGLTIAIIAGGLIVAGVIMWALLVNAFSSD
jgi:hypothetical protein